MENMLKESKENILFFLFFETGSYYVSQAALILLWLFWRWLSWTICWGWLWTTILPISASQVARITGVSHRAWLKMFF
jgi:hypothetical protein